MKKKEKFYSFCFLHFNSRYSIESLFLIQVCFMSHTFDHTKLGIFKENATHFKIIDLLHSYLKCFIHGIEDGLQKRRIWELSLSIIDLAFPFIQVRDKFHSLQ